jgi:hypothetical protein
MTYKEAPWYRKTDADLLLSQVTGIADELTGISYPRRARRWEYEFKWGGVRF